MVPGTRPQKKQKAATMAAANQQELRTPIKLTRQSAAMPSPRGRPPPRIRNPLPPKNTSKANPKPIAISSASQLQGHLTPNTMPSLPGANPEHTPRPTITMSQSRQMTPATSINQPIPTDTSPGGQSSRQSNDINESAEQFDAANLEGNTCEGEPSDDLVPGKQYILPSICFSNHYLQLLLL